MNKINLAITIADPINVNAFENFVSALKKYKCINVLLILDNNSSKNINKFKKRQKKSQFNIRKIRN